MAIDPQLLEILACPVCKVSVTLTRDGQGLRCGQCLRVYPIQDDIPIMLVEEAFYDKKPSAKIQAKSKKGGAKAAPKAKARPQAKARPKPKAKKR
jgi:uncharacterized protein YbaR (Trm112 family)